MKVKRYYLNDRAEFHWEIVDRRTNKVVQHIDRRGTDYPATDNRRYAVRRTLWWNNGRAK